MAKTPLKDAVQVVGGEELAGPPPPTPKPTLPPAPVARTGIVKPTERAPKGFHRYRIRTGNSTGPLRYVVEGNEQLAKVEYLKACGLPPEALADLVVVPLPD